LFRLPPVLLSGRSRAWGRELFVLPSSFFVEIRYFTGMPDLFNGFIIFSPNVDRNGKGLKPQAK